MSYRFPRIVLSLLTFSLLFAPVSAAQAPAPAFDLEKLSKEAEVWLTELIRINTTNPPGNELAAARFLASIFEKEGISTEVIESAPGRGIVIARLRSGPIPDPSRALLLLAHTDVVGVDRSKWSVDPFAGAVKDGYLYGRGTLDDKGMVIANLAVMVALKRAAVPLTRDIIYLAEGDEEEGGAAGIEFAVKNHWDKIAAGFALNEGGHTLVKNGRVFYVGIQASEKIPVNVTVIATGTAGHASIPRKDNPVNHLAAALAKIAAYEAPAKPQTVTRRYFEQLAAISDQEQARWMRALEIPDRTAQAARRLSEMNPSWSAMLRNTISITMLQAGVRSNVIPSEARATMNIRLLPGESIDELLTELRKLVDDPAIRIEAQPASRMPAPPSSIETDLYKIIERATPQVFPGAVTLPLLSTWATDSAQLRTRNVQAYGIIAFPLTEEELARMHSDDERIPLESFRKGVEFLFRIVSDFAQSK